MLVPYPAETAALIEADAANLPSSVAGEGGSRPGLEQPPTPTFSREGGESFGAASFYALPREAPLLMPEQTFG
jgi:hypothetical protein